MRRVGMAALWSLLALAIVGFALLVYFYSPKLNDYVVLDVPATATPEP